MEGGGRVQEEEERDEREKKGEGEEKRYFVVYSPNFVQNVSMHKLIRVKMYKH